MVDFALDDEDRASNATSDVEQDEVMADADDRDHDDAGPRDDEAGDDEDDENQDDRADDDGGEDGGEEEEEEDGKEQADGGGPESTAGEIHQVNGLETSTDPTTETAGPATAQDASSMASTSTGRRFEVRAEALSASSYDIVPTIAAPQSTSINAIAATPDMRYWFTGGADGFIRKFDGVASINGKTQLTVAQRHPFVDSVVKAGVLMSYWDNEEPLAKTMGEEPPLSPVYALAVQHQALWLLSGLESGCVNLYSVRHDEGKRITSLKKHTSAVSVLSLSADETSVLSGSWDKAVHDWDLHTGQVTRSFEGSAGQLAAIEVRPASSMPVPQDTLEPEPNSDTFSSNADRPNANGHLANGTHGLTNGVSAEEGGEDAPGDTDSLFDGPDSLFGDTDAAEAPSGGNFGDEEDEFSKALALNSTTADPAGLDAPEDLVMPDASESLDTVQLAAPEVDNRDVGNNQADEQKAQTNGEHIKSESEAANPDISSLPKIDPDEIPSSTASTAPASQDATATAETTFLAASIDGSIRIWDRRQPDPVARIMTRSGTPPWCMAACWSPDGNHIYAGRRNGTVEEYSLHHGLKTPHRTFKFPLGSGAVTAIKAMPNGRGLVCASHDILRLYDLKQRDTGKHSTVPFLIVPGPPRAGVISALHMDPTCSYMLSAAGTRGWEGTNTECLIGYEIACIP